MTSGSSIATSPSSARPASHAGTDIGLLALRFGLAAIFLGKGTEKMFGFFGGPGINGFARQLAGAGGRGFGYTGDTTLLAWVAAFTEVGGGLLVLFGLVMPLGAAALFGMAVNLFAVRWGAPVLPNPGQNVAVDVLQTSMIIGVLFAGPGRISLDHVSGLGARWQHRPVTVGLTAAVVGALVAVVMLLIYR